MGECGRLQLMLQLFVFSLVETKFLLQGLSTAPDGKTNHSQPCISIRSCWSTAFWWLFPKPPQVSLFPLHRSILINTQVQGKGIPEQTSKTLSLCHFLLSDTCLSVSLKVSPISHLCLPFYEATSLSLGSHHCFIP